MRFLRIGEKKTIYIAEDLADWIVRRFTEDHKSGKVGQKIKSEDVPKDLFPENEEANRSYEKALEEELDGAQCEGNRWLSQLTLHEMDEVETNLRLGECVR